MPFKRGTKIDIDFILKHVSEEDIFEKYFAPVVYGQSVHNSNRSDKYAGCKFYVNKSTGRIRFKDFGKGYNWDCFDVAQQEIGLPFKQTLIKIAQDFGLIEGHVRSGGARASYSHTPNGIEARKLFANEVKEKRIKVEGTRQDFNWRERKYWSRFGINTSHLVKFYVYGFDRAYLTTTYMDGSEKVSALLHTRSELKFAYYLGKGEWKLYYPERPKGQTRFIQTRGDTLQGYYLLPDRSENLVWTKAYKDVICLYSLFSIPSVAAQSESIIIPKEQMIEMQERFDRHFIFYDNDFSGMRAAIKNIKEYPHLIPIMYPSSRPKDLSDNVDKFGKKQVIQELKPILL